MKIDNRSAERFCRAPDDKAVGILLYGENQGLVEDRALQIANAVLGGAPDPFQLSDVTSQRLKETPSIIADEMQARSLMGGRRLLRLRDPNAAALDELERLLSEAVPGDALILVTMASLAPRDKARKLFESHARAAAVPCYADDGVTMEGFIGDFLRQHKLEIDGSARAFLAGQLGADRQVARRELEKLALYAKDTGQAIGLADVAAVIDEGESLQLSDIAFATFSGDQRRLDSALDRMFRAKSNPIAVLGVVLRHAQRLHLLEAGMKQGAAPEQAAKALRPPLFFKDKNEFLAQSRQWRGKRLQNALELLQQADLECKSTGSPDQMICRRALMRLAAAGRPR